MLFNLKGLLKPHLNLAADEDPPLQSDDDGHDGHDDDGLLHTTIFDPRAASCAGASASSVLPPSIPDSDTDAMMSTADFDYMYLQLDDAAAVSGDDDDEMFDFFIESFSKDYE